MFAERKSAIKSKMQSCFESGVVGPSVAFPRHKSDVDDKSPRCLVCKEHSRTGVAQPQGPLNGSTAHTAWAKISHND